MNKPKVLLLDIETSPILANVWGLWKNDSIALNQIQKDWHLLSFCAKWLDDDKVVYADQRNEKNVENDKKLLEKVWKLLDEADVVITQNGDKFDIKKLNTRFIIHDMKPPSPFQSIDTLKLAKKSFGFTSNKLEYMTKKLNTKYKKLTHKKFPGFELWKECLSGNIQAWKEMETYNRYDVLSLEELYKKLAPWGTNVNFSVYNDDHLNTCSCGSTQFIKNGFKLTKVGKYQRYQCKHCGSYQNSKVNVLSKNKRNSLTV